MYVRNPSFGVKIFHQSCNHSILQGPRYQMPRSFRCNRTTKNPEGQHLILRPLTQKLPAFRDFPLPFTSSSEVGGGWQRLRIRQFTVRLRVTWCVGRGAMLDLTEAVCMTGRREAKRRRKRLEPGTTCVYHSVSTLGGLHHERTSCLGDSEALKFYLLMQLGG